MTAWLHKLIPDSGHITEGKLQHRLQILLKHCASLTQEELPQALSLEYQFDSLPDVLTSLGITRLNISDPDTYTLFQQENVTNDVVVALCQVVSKLNLTPTLTRKWLVKLSVSCHNCSDDKLRLQVGKVMNKYKQLLKNKKGNTFEIFMKDNFLIVDQKVATSLPIAQCQQCRMKDELISMKDKSLIQCGNDLKFLNLSKEKVDSEIVVTKQALHDIQKEKSLLLSKIEDMKCSVCLTSKLEKKVKVLEEQLEDLINTKLYYKRNADLNQEKDRLEKRVSELEEICNKDQK